jgi:hypothetical protein
MLEAEKSIWIKKPHCMENITAILSHFLISRYILPGDGREWVDHRPKADNKKRENVLERNFKSNGGKKQTLRERSKTIFFFLAPTLT